MLSLTNMVYKITCCKLLNIVSFLILFLNCGMMMAQQNQYIDLHPAQILINPPNKAGWNLVFDDEFNGSKSSVWNNGYCSGTIGPDNDPFYYLDANYLFDDSTLRDRKSVV